METLSLYSENLCNGHTENSHQNGELSVNGFLNGNSIDDAGISESFYKKIIHETIQAEDRTINFTEKNQNEENENGQNEYTSQNGNLLPNDFQNQSKSNTSCLSNGSIVHTSEMSTSAENCHYEYNCNLVNKSDVDILLEIETSSGGSLTNNKEDDLNKKVSKLSHGLEEIAFDFGNSGVLIDEGTTPMAYGQNSSGSGLDVKALNLQTTCEKESFLQLNNNFESNSVDMDTVDDNSTSGDTNEKRHVRSPPKFAPKNRENANDLVKRILSETSADKKESVSHNHDSGKIRIDMAADAEDSGYRSSYSSTGSDYISEKSGARKKEKDQKSLFERRLEDIHSESDKYDKNDSIYNTSNFKFEDQADAYSKYKSERENDDNRRKYKLKSDDNASNHSASNYDYNENIDDDQSEIDAELKRVEERFKELKALKEKKIRSKQSMDRDMDTSYQKKPNSRLSMDSDRDFDTIPAYQKKSNSRQSIDLDKDFDIIPAYQKKSNSWQSMDTEGSSYVSKSSDEKSLFQKRRIMRQQNYDDEYNVRSSQGSSYFYDEFEDIIPDEEFEPTKRPETAGIVKEKSSEIRGVIDKQADIVSKLRRASESFDDLQNEIKEMKQQFWDTQARRKALNDDEEEEDECFEKQKKNVYTPGNYVKGSYRNLMRSNSEVESSSYSRNDSRNDTDFDSESVCSNDSSRNGRARPRGRFNGYSLDDDDTNGISQQKSSSRFLHTRSHSVYGDRSYMDRESIDPPSYKSVAASYEANEDTYASRFAGTSAARSNFSSKYSNISSSLDLSDSLTAGSKFRRSQTIGDYDTSASSYNYGGIKAPAPSFSSKFLEKVRERKQTGEEVKREKPFKSRFVRNSSLFETDADLYSRPSTSLGFSKYSNSKSEYSTPPRSSTALGFSSTKNYSTSEENQSSAVSSSSTEKYTAMETSVADD